MVPAEAIAVDNTPDTDLDTWNDSNMSSDEEAAEKIDNRLVKSQARRIINVHGYRILDIVKLQSLVFHLFHNS